MIEIRNLRFRYPDGDFSLNVPRLAIAERERVALVGPSGSGKTTLLNLMAGIVRPQAGSLMTNGVLLSELPDRARRDFRISSIGLVFQQFELLEYLRVLDNILLPFRLNRTLSLDATTRGRAAALARSVGIDDLLGRYPEKLSQGERQRVAVCRALLVRPPLILADEPTGNLDPFNKQRVLDILIDYACDRGATLVTVTHDHDLLPRFDRVIDFKHFYRVGAEAPRRAEGA